MQLPPGRTDVLVNNAGISFIPPRGEYFGRRISPGVESESCGAVSAGQGIWYKDARRQARLHHVASVAGLVGIAGRAAYNASKHGLIGLTRTLAAEWGGRGVRVNAVCSGWVKTEMDTADQAGGSYTDADIIGRVPIGRFATPDDISFAIAFLADEKDSGFINGQALTVDGGWTADGSWESLRRRLVWSAIGGPLTHYNASAQVFTNPDGQTRVVWIADLLPNDAAGAICLMMEQGMTVMKATLDRLAGDELRGSRNRDRRATYSSSGLPST